MRYDMTSRLVKRACQHLNCGCAYHAAEIDLG